MRYLPLFVGVMVSGCVTTGTHQAVVDELAKTRGQLDETRTQLDQTNGRLTETTQQQTTCSQNLTAAMDQNQSRDTADAKAGSQIGGSLSIHLGQPNIGLKLGRRLFEHRRHHLARAAPRGPKVDQERQVTPFGMSREPTGIQHQRLALKQGAAASSALAGLAQAAARHAIECMRRRESRPQERRRSAAAGGVKGCQW